MTTGLPISAAAEQVRGPGDASTPDATPATGAAQGDDAGPSQPANCPSAIARQKRLASAAELRRMRRAAVTVTKATIAQAEDLATEWWEAQGIAFVEASARRGTQHIGRSARDYRPNIGEMPRATCRALAARDAVACRGLPEGESVGCLAWIALHAATRPGASCADAPEALREACRVIVEPGATCPSDAGPAREACERVRGARAGVAEACASLDGETHCTWAGLLSSLSSASSSAACDAVRPGGDRRSPRARRTHALCAAVASGAPLRCPQDTAVIQVDDVVTWFEARVIGGPKGLRLVTNLQVDRPAACATEVELRRGDVVIETVRWSALPDSRAGLPDWRDVKTAGSPTGVVAVAAITCAPRIRWKSP
ncbi:MAG: hypothetical protein QF464_02965 [Myxococcota bacterium]|nr:hypothetical protein [Myxococcota bacterium]